jgi:BirA family transcriptional regulator, biotin operon repressor / biotin---[acetyl-CoA-carboxylase] ligase
MPAEPADGLASFFQLLASDGAAPFSAWPPEQDLDVYGLERVGGSVVPLVRYDPLDPEAIRRALSRGARDWLRALEVWPSIGSTNAELMGRAQSASVDGCICLAEVQTHGRGRRGRSWFSPFGANLAVSIGLAPDLPVAQLGGASLVVGLAVLDALDQLGVRNTALKWPNDVLLNGAKLGGILIEMLQVPNVQLVVGIGLNVVLPPRVRAELDQEVADLAGASFARSRSELAGRVISSVVEFTRQFEQVGFAPFVPAFNDRHHYHGREVRLIQGEELISGTVVGVSDAGALQLRSSGKLVEFHGGEVSLRKIE